MVVITINLDSWHFGLKSDHNLHLTQLKSSSGCYNENLEYWLMQGTQVYNHLHSYLKNTVNVNLHSLFSDQLTRNQKEFKSRMKESLAFHLIKLPLLNECLSVCLSIHPSDCLAVSVLFQFLESDVDKTNYPNGLIWLL